MGAFTVVFIVYYPYFSYIIWQFSYYVYLAAPINEISAHQQQIRKFICGNDKRDVLLRLNMI